jgi:hypothetical protein
MWEIGRSSRAVTLRRQQVMRFRFIDCLKELLEEIYLLVSGGSHVREQKI